MAEWNDVERIYHAALARPPAERPVFLVEACAGDETLRREVASLLAQPVSTPGLLDAGAAVAAHVLSEDPSVMGRTVGPYQVTGRLGAGGMGEVFRARDPKLGRDVALKILPRAFTSDPDRLARFEREARVLATLNHPNIAQIYGLEDAGGVRALVMELVDGVTLAEKLASGSRLRGSGSRLEEALAIAKQIAEALEAAHDKGIIHRDLKPANIKITPTGVVKVLDFGLAKADPASGSGLQASDLSGAPTITVGDTREGVILGTAAYMSPEQARGSAVDKRTDIWAFGCVLYEMLTGRAPFRGDTVSDLIASILEREPDWNALPSSTPGTVARLIRRCLAKDPKRRLRDFADIRLELDEAGERGGGTTPPRAGDARPQRGWALWLGAAGALAGVAGIVWAVSRGSEVADSAETRRTTITLPQGQQLYAFDGAQPLALSPTGQHIAYVAQTTGNPQLFVRAMRSFDARPVAGSDGARYPFFSPDGRAVAFFAEGQLKRASVDGGASAVICDVPTVGRGGTWGDDGSIIFDPGIAGLARVAATGGKPELLTSADPSIDRGNFSWPSFLPDGRAVLATIDGQMGVFSLADRRWRLLGAGTQAQYLSSGHLLYHAPAVQEGELHVVPFDAATLTMAGSPALVQASVFRGPGDGGAYFAASLAGTLVYAPGGRDHTLVRVDRAGRRTPLLQERRGFRFPRVSPDGQRVAVTIDPRPSQIWVFDINRRSGVPLTTKGHNIISLWTQDGRRVLFFSDGDIWWRDAEGAGPAERLLERDGAQYPMAWTADGRLLFDDNAQFQATKSDVGLMPLNGAPRTVLGSLAGEYQPALSPDGRWLAYASDESGRREVYLRPFPNVDERKWPISSAGGQSPIWSRDGRELFFMNGPAMMTVAITAASGRLTAGSPMVLFTGPFDSTQDHNFDVFPDGTFVMVEADPDSKPTRIHVVENWFGELKSPRAAP